MTSLIERSISILAPHHCFSCGKEGNVLCAACFDDTFSGNLEVCALCNKPTSESRICEECQSSTDLRRVWMAAEYGGVVKRLVKAYKFERARAAYSILAEGMCAALPYLEDDVIVVHVPTAAQRVRQRGYDQARLLAGEIARRRHWQQRSLLRRRHGLRQVGSGKAQRLAQAATAFEYVGGDLGGKHVLLVDDVTTSGATLAAAARLLVQAGAASVDAVVVAKHMLEQR